MKRVYFRAMVLLLLGAGLNVPVAWCISAFAPDDTSRQVGSAVSIVIEMPDPNQPNNSLVEVAQERTAEQLGFGLWLVRPSGADSAESDIHAGWPLASLSYTYGSGLSEWMLMPSWGRGKGYWDDSLDCDPWRHGLRIPDRVVELGADNGRRLPLRPIWLGLAINATLYAGIIWVVWLGMVQTARTIRRHRGQCPSCGYPIGESPRCTECGVMLPE